MKLRSRKMNNLFFTLPALMLTFSIAAQEGENLVNNPSFENAQSNKIRRLGDIERADGWVSATGARADLFSADAKFQTFKQQNMVTEGKKPKMEINYEEVIGIFNVEKETRLYLIENLK